MIKQQIPSLFYILIVNHDISQKKDIVILA